jgi:hypothetical protein
MFTTEDRRQAQEHLVRRAEEDPRIVAAALVGSSAGGGDRWSDLDLTLGVADESSVAEVLADWTRDAAESLGAVRLFDLEAGPSLYRVFLLPGCLQVDVSFTPAAQFGAIGPHFGLLFGETTERAPLSAPSIDHLFGLGVHHALRTRICVERGRLWQAHYWLDELRHELLSLMCVRRGLRPAHARGADDLPASLRSALVGTLVRDLARTELLRALRQAVQLLAAEGAELTRPVADRLRELMR